MQITNNLDQTAQDPRPSTRRQLTAAEEVFTSIVPREGASGLGKRSFTVVEETQSLGDACCEKGLAALHNHQYDEPFSWFQEALKVCPESAEIWYHQGCAQSRQLVKEPALASFDTALKYDPAFAPAWAEKGRIAKLQLHWDDAISYLKVAYAIDNSSVIRDELIVIYFHLATAYPDLNKGIEYYDEILALDVNNVEALKKKGLLQGKMQRYDEAVAALDKAFELGTITTELNIYSKILAGDALKAGDFAKVRQYRTINLKIDPENRNFLLDRGVANYKLGLYQDAVYDLERCLPSSQSLSFLGASLLKVKRYAASINFLNEAITREPSDSALKEWLDEAHRSLHKDLKTL